MGFTTNVDGVVPAKVESTSGLPIWTGSYWINNRTSSFRAAVFFAAGALFAAGVLFADAELFAAGVLFAGVCHMGGPKEVQE